MAITSNLRNLYTKLDMRQETGWYLIVEMEHYAHMILFNM